MRSSTGQHFVALDHVRALAAFIVFVFHFLPKQGGYFTTPIDPGQQVDLWAAPLALIAEGHVGVSLFMVLSGYLFARLLDGREINFASFLFNRALRLLPLLIFVVILYGLREWWRGGDLIAYGLRTLSGVILPTLPNGGWSVTVEMHFYLLLPMLLCLMRKHLALPLLLIVAALVLRAVLFTHFDPSPKLYWTIVARIDQFVVGMLAWHLSGWFAHNHFRAAYVFGGFVTYYWWWSTNAGYTTLMLDSALLWLRPLVPLIDGMFCGALVAWYDNSFRFQAEGFSGFVAKIGECSYSIYLLHLFMVSGLARHLSSVFDTHTLYSWMAVGTIVFVAFLPIAWLSYTLIEKPFLRHRVPYIK